MKKVGLLGCGNIGGIIARHPPPAEFVVVYDQVSERARRIAERLNVTACTSFEEFVSHDFEIALEAASVTALRAHAKAILTSGKDLLALSVGALAEPAFREDILTLARRLDRRIRIPSGALFGLDNVKVGRISKFNRLMLRTTKSPQSLQMQVTERTLLFRGSATECVEQYPKNVNVAVALSLAAGSEATVELWVDPNISRNTHEVVISGEFGEADIHIANLPCPDNPSTSYLAALSVLTVLHDLNEPLIVGT